jgi:hypothetical protein
MMHLTLIFTAIIVSCSTVRSHPLTAAAAATTTTDEPEARDDPTAPRPLAQFFKKIFSALRPKYATTTESPLTTRISIPSQYLSQSSLEIHEIPNFVDFSTYLLDSFSSNNSAIKFSYLSPNVTALRGGDYSVISFVIPHSVMTMTKDNSSNATTTSGILNNFLNFFRFPWRSEPRPPKPGSDTVYQQFPSFFEYFAQRVQAYFSIYKFIDESRLNNTIVIEAIEEGHENDELVSEISVPENDALDSTTEMTTTDDDVNEDTSPFP